MPPAIGTNGLSHRPSYWSDLKTLLNPTTSPPNRTRSDLLRSILSRSVRIKITNEPNGVQLPLKVRPALVVLNILVLTFLGLLGFHPKASHLPISDKLLHFLCFFLATLLFYCIWDLDLGILRSTPSLFWHRLPLVLTFITCFMIGGVGSEFVQSLLPFKIFDWGDILANLCGCSLGLWTSWHVEKRIREKRELRRFYTPLDFDSQDGPQGGHGFEDDDDDEAEDDIEARPARAKPSTQNNQRQSSQSPPAATPAQAPLRTEDLFSIDDEDDQNGNKNQEENVWSSQQSSNAPL
ncbi:unnamed protein product [Sympodiomycopsis kandeliae]